MDHRRLPHPARHRQGRQGRARRAFIRSSLAPPCCARWPSAPGSTPPMSTTSSGAPARSWGRRAAISGGCPRSMPATTCAPARVTLDRFCGSGITSAIMAANAIMAGAEDLVIAGGTEMMSMEGTARRRPVHDGRRQSAPARPASAIASGRLRRCGGDAGRHHARGRRQARAGKPEAGGARDRERLFRQEPRPRLSRGRQPRARQGGISAAADHAGRSRRAEAGIPGGGGLSARRQGHHLPQSDPAETSRS